MLQKWPLPAPTNSQSNLRRLYRNSLLKRFRKEDSIDSNSKQLQDPCRISAVIHPWKLDRQPDLPATDVERAPGGRYDPQGLIEMAQWPEPAPALKDIRSCPFTSSPSYHTADIYRSVRFQTKRSRDISGWPTEPCREDIMTSGSGSIIRTAKGIRKSFWRPVLTLFK